MEDRATNAGPCSFLRPGSSSHLSWEWGRSGPGLLLGLTLCCVDSQDETPKAKRFFPGGWRCTEVSVLNRRRHLLYVLRARPLSGSSACAKVSQGLAAGSSPGESSSRSREKLSPVSHCQGPVVFHGFIFLSFGW